MSQPRVNLQRELTEILNSNEVYFQPPDKIKMRYPAIVYNLDRIDTRSADNAKYAMFNRYSVVLMTKNPDSPTVQEILRRFPQSSLDRTARNDNINHYYYTIYY